MLINKVKCSKAMAGDNVSHHPFHPAVSPRGLHHTRQSGGAGNDKVRHPLQQGNSQMIVAPLNPLLDNWHSEVPAEHLLVGAAPHLYMALA
jgi:hypothetical protein